MNVSTKNALFYSNKFPLPAPPSNFFSLQARLNKQSCLGIGVIVFDNLLRIAFSAVAESKIQPLFEGIYEACRELRG
jgi:hypothetical protein